MNKIKLLDYQKESKDFYSEIYFPDGQTKLTFNGLSSMGRAISFRFTDEKDLLTLIKVKKYLDFSGIFNCELRITYMLGARSDRVEPYESFDLKVYSEIINSLNFSKVSVFAPHSAVTPALLDRFTPYITTSWEEMVSDYLNNLPETPTLVFPDNGAEKRYVGQLNGYKYVTCSKTRDSSTGKLSNFKILDELEESANYVIVDDLIDGGGTFLGILELLKKANPKSVKLMAAHGIFSKGYEVLTGVFDEVIVTNSYKDYGEDIPHNLKVISII